MAEQLLHRAQIRATIQKMAANACRNTCGLTRSG